MISQLHFASMNALFKLSFVENQSQHRAPIVYIGSWCLFSAAAAAIDPLKKLRRWGCAYIHVYVHFKAQRFRRQKGHLLASDKSLHRNYTKNAHFFWSTQWFYFKTSKKVGKSLFLKIFLVLEVTVCVCCTKVSSKKYVLKVETTLAKNGTIFYKDFSVSRFGPQGKKF